MDYVTFGLILDEVVFPDGRVASDLLGGGGPQTAFGMRLWSERVGLAARVGADLPGAARDWLRETGIDTAGVQVTGWPTLRARQHLSAQGGRRHEWQVPAEAVGAQLARSVEALPPGYRGARGWHLGVHPEEPNLDFLAALRALGGLVSVETFRAAQQLPAPAALRALLGATDIFSPNLAAAQSLVGPSTAPEAVERLLEAGASVVALRLGAAGSLVADRRSGQLARIPAVPVTVVDPVGAGNAYCGGFLTGWIETGALVEAGLRGAVAASFLLEQYGVPPSGDHAQVKGQRLDQLRRLVKGTTA
jgi:sugar/nucleoside kinase (ribokinase family)